MHLLKLESVSRDFDVSRPWLNRVLEHEAPRTLRAVDRVSFEILKGETLGLVGESGCGKSTVARLIAGLYAPTEGRIEFRGKRLQMIFQDPYASLNPRWRVRKIIAEPMLFLQTKKDVSEFLLQVGLSPDDAERYPHEFSGGQRQRIGIARALASAPSFIVADEPVSALDVSVQAQIINLLEDLRDELKLSFLFIAHDLNVVRHFSDRVAVMYLGKIVEIAQAEDIYKDPSHPYTEALLADIPVADPTVQRKHILLKGEIPSPTQIPPGCRFHTRCLYRFEPCDKLVPKTTDLGNGHFVDCHLRG